MAMAVSRSRANRPISEINTTPLIDVLLVLLIMIILSIPIKPHSLVVPLPGPPPPGTHTAPDRNKIVVTAGGAILWNGEAVSQDDLSTLLVRTTRLRTKPELLFEPEANASYDVSVKVINTITDAGVTKFGFVGNHRYREFARN
jgi:biopolymer transport protein ExbD